MGVNMEARELRIGNFILVEEKVYKVEMNDSYGVLGIDKRGLVRLENVKPIPITEEWLLKFGFEIYAESVIMKAYKIGFNLITHDYLFDLCWLKRIDEGMESHPFYRNGRFKIKYVHQLQNLYFALTGEELKWE